MFHFICVFIFKKDYTEVDAIFACMLHVILFFKFAKQSRDCKAFSRENNIFVHRLESLLLLSAVAVVSVVVGSSIAVVLCMAFVRIQSIRRTGKFRGPPVILNPFKDPIFSTSASP